MGKNMNKNMLIQMQNTDDYISDIKCLIAESRQRICKVVNVAMVQTYWLIGKRIVIEEQKGNKKAKYGESVLKKLSKTLTSEFGNGFSYANLRNMRQFYLTYPNDEICYTLCSNLSWSHNRLIMRVADEKARDYYLKEAISQQWSVRQTEREIQSFSYYRLLENGQIMEREVIDGLIDVKRFVKDPYVLEFAGLSVFDKHKEKDLEKALIRHMKEFLLELGKGFSFVKEQYRVSTETSHFYIDLVFYNYILKCFVLIDLKSGKLTHKDVGQMDMYIRMFDDIKKDDSDNPTIGILMCAEKEETVVKYSVLNSSDQIFASKYLPYLPTEEELRRELDDRAILYLQGEEGE